MLKQQTLSADPRISVRAIFSSEAFALLEQRWNSLLEISATNDFFQRWEWLWTWWNIFREEEWQLCVILVERGQELIGIAPFYVKEERYFGFSRRRTLMFLGSGENEQEEIFSEYLDIISRRGEEERVTGHVMEFVLSHNLCDSICLSNIILFSKTVTILKQFCQNHSLFFGNEFKMESPFIGLPHSWEDYLNFLSSSMRYEIRSDNRKLQNLGEVKIRKTESLNDLEEDFSEISRLHQTRWGFKGMTGVFGNSKFVLFHKTIMPVMLKNGYLQLWFLSLSSQNLASCYNIQYNNKVYFYQTGFDHTVAKKVSVGLVLKGYCIEQAIASKLSEYDFMGGGGTYKGRWTNASRSIGEIFIPISPNAKYTWVMRNMARGLKRKFRRISVHETC